MMDMSIQTYGLVETASAKDKSNICLMYGLIELSQKRNLRKNNH
jgi:hypothetical protein